MLADRQRVHSSDSLFHKMIAGWELPMSHCMLVAVGKGIDRAHGMCTKENTC